MTEAIVKELRVLKAHFQAKTEEFEREAKEAKIDDNIISGYKSHFNDVSRILNQRINSLIIQAKKEISEGSVVKLNPPLKRNLPIIIDELVELVEAHNLNKNKLIEYIEAKFEANHILRDLVTNTDLSK